MYYKLPFNKIFSYAVVPDKCPLCKNELEEFSSNCDFSTLGLVCEKYLLCNSCSVLWLCISSSFHKSDEHRT